MPLENIRSALLDATIIPVFSFFLKGFLSTYSIQVCTVDFLSLLSGMASSITSLYPNPLSTLIDTDRIDGPLYHLTLYTNVYPAHFPSLI